MNLQEAVEQQLHQLFLDLAERIASGEFGEMDEDTMCGVPSALFKAEMYLVSAWRHFDPGRAVTITARSNER